VAATPDRALAQLHSVQARYTGTTIAQPRSSQPDGCTRAQSWCASEGSAKSSTGTAPAASVHAVTEVAGWRPASGLTRTV
jgi:hypothetical protein